ARAALHPWEEPCISGKGGSGTVFFTGCNLRCIYCQNREISCGGEVGKTVSASELEHIMLRLQDDGAENINLVTPTPYALQLIPVLQRVRKELRIPVVYNCGGYESVETLRALDGLIDVYLPDCKYRSSDLSATYSAASDYFAVATDALAEMLRQTGAPVIDESGMLQRGVLVRHLVLPGCRQDSIQLLTALHERFGNHAFLLSLMSQYTPEFASADAPGNLRRRVTAFEYDRVLEAVESLGFDGYLQKRSSATADYTPDFLGER
ncbi:MAG: radical SAM protein, partial [Clostridia bacterium]|nr:radical SAM protein [Clostridia bacterium]